MSHAAAAIKTKSANVGMPRGLSFHLTTPGSSAGEEQARDSASGQGIITRKGRDAQRGSGPFSD